MKRYFVFTVDRIIHVAVFKPDSDYAEASVSLSKLIAAQVRAVALIIAPDKV